MPRDGRSGDPESESAPPDRPVLLSSPRAGRRRDVKPRSQPAHAVLQCPVFSLLFLEGRKAEVTRNGHSGRKEKRIRTFTFLLWLCLRAFFSSSALASVFWQASVSSSARVLSSSAFWKKGGVGEKLAPGDKKKLRQFFAREMGWWEKRKGNENVLFATVSEV